MNSQVPVVSVVNFCYFSYKNFFLIKKANKTTTNKFECKIWLQALDRLQQRLDLLVIPVSSFASECEISVIRILTERSHRWVTIHDMCKFYTTTNGYRLLWANERTSFCHLYFVCLLSTETGTVNFH